MQDQVTQFLNYMVNEKDCSANTTAAYQNDLPVRPISGRLCAADGDASHAIGAM